VVIDQTRFEAFWRNPDKYRLTYELNLTPKALPYGLARGSALHLIEELSAKKWSREQINAALKGEGDNLRGYQTEKLPEKAIGIAWGMYDELQRHSAGLQVIGVEQEFKFDIPGSPHSMVGRLDKIVMRNGELWCEELKTANAKSRFDQRDDEWKWKAQAGFEIIGARTLGYDVRGVLVRYIIEAVPPKAWPHIEARRSDHQLQVLQLNVHQTCEIIQMLKRTFGADQSWPHLGMNWPCGTPGKCEYEGICQHATKQLTSNDLIYFKPREEHLEMLRKPELPAELVVQ
jgi:hypothetical protein